MGASIVSPPPRATGVIYVPTTPGNWSPTPNNVGTALDQLASRTTSGTPLTFAGFDSAGLLTSLINWQYTDPSNVYFGEGFNWSPGIDIQNSGYTLNNMQANLIPTASVTSSYTTVFSPSANLNGGAFDIGGISLIDSYSPISGSGNIQTLRVLNSTFDLVGTNVVNTYIGINPYLHVHSGATVGVLNTNNPILYNGAIDIDAGGFLPNGLQLVGLGGTINVLPGNGSTLSNIYMNFNSGTPYLTVYQNSVTVDGTVSGGINGYSNAMNLLGTLNANSYSGVQDNTNFQSGSTVQFVNIFESNPQIHTNNIQDFTGIQISPSGGGIIQNQLYGLDVNLTQISLNSTTDYPRAINVNGGLITANMALNIMDGLGVFNANNFVTQVGIAPGSPITATEWINFNNAMLFYAQDDFTSSIGLGITSSLYGGQVAVVSGKTIDLLSGGLIGASVPVQSTGGTVTTLSGMRYLGLFSAGGTLAITNQIGFFADAAFAGDGFSSNFWAFRSDFTTGYNYLGSNLAIGTLSKQVTAPTTGIEIHTKDIFLDTGRYIGQFLNLIGSTSGNLLVSVPAVMTPYAVVMPGTQGAVGTVLQNDGSGNLSWALSSTIASVVIQKFTLSSGDITNKGVIIGAIPQTPALVILNVSGFGEQLYGTQFVINSNLAPNTTLDWTTLGLDGVLQAGDNLTVTFIPMSAPPSLSIEKFLISPTDVTNKGVVVANIPINPANVILSYIGFGEQLYSVDFTVNSNLVANQTIDWTGLGLDGVIQAGDNLTITYQY